MRRNFLLFLLFFRNHCNEIALRLLVDLRKRLTCIDRDNLVRALLCCAVFCDSGGKTIRRRAFLRRQVVIRLFLLNKSSIAGDFTRSCSRIRRRHKYFCCGTFSRWIVARRFQMLLQIGTCPGVLSCLDGGNEAVLLFFLQRSQLCRDTFADAPFLEGFSRRIRKLRERL